VEEVVGGLAGEGVGGGFNFPFSIFNWGSGHGWGSHWGMGWDRLRPICGKDARVTAASALDGDDRGSFAGDKVRGRGVR
jgi:hypothetical protein